MKMETLNEIADAVHELAIKQGWFDDNPNEDVFIERVCNNLHDEISELHEAWRNGTLDDLCDKATKMTAAGIPVLTCVEEELADIVIRALDAARQLKVDIQWAVKVKHEFNATRPRRHGGKRS